MIWSPQNTHFHHLAGSREGPFRHPGTSTQLRIPDWSQPAVTSLSQLRALRVDGRRAEKKISRKEGSQGAPRGRQREKLILRSSSRLRADHQRDCEDSEKCDHIFSSDPMCYFVKEPAIQRTFYSEPHVLLGELDTKGILADGLVKHLTPPHTPSLAPLSMGESPPSSP